jgi:hypothetical protein
MTRPTSRQHDLKRRGALSLLCLVRLVSRHESVEASPFVESALAPIVAPVGIPWRVLSANLATFGGVGDGLDLCSILLNT